MSNTEIHNFIVHQITRDSAKNAYLKARARENRVDELTSTVALNLLELFNKSGLQTGTFHQESGKPKFEQTLAKYTSFNEGVFSFSNFRQMTVDLARILEGEMNKGAGKVAKPNYVVFFFHTTNRISYLSVITLLETQGFTLKNLSFATVERLDLDKLHLAARIRLNDWEDEMLKDRYISFRIGRNSEMRDYFQDFIGCIEFTASRIETKSLVEAIKQCCEELFPDAPSKVNELQDLACIYCKSNKDVDGKISIISLGKHLFPDNDDYLLKLTQGEKYKLSERVSIDNKSLSGLTRFSGRTKKMSISFDADLMESKKVVYNDGVLIFHEIPKELRDSLDNKR
ncbi:TPA: nucleoid-associated protein [Enterobacter ludwigii]